MSGRFRFPLRVEQVDAETWRLTALLVFVSARYQTTIIVPEGTVTDFASVPRIPLAYWLFAGVGQAAAVVHDWTYRVDTNVPRDVADNIFLEAMEALDAAALEKKSGLGRVVAARAYAARRRAMWLGVRAFGSSRYRAAPAPGLEQYPASKVEREPELE